MPHTVFLSAGFRTPLGAFRGDLAGLRFDALALPVLQATLAASGDVEAAFFGLPQTTGWGPVPGRRLARLAELEVPCFQSVSGLEALFQAVCAVESGRLQHVLVCAVSQPSQVPFYLPQAREGKRLGHARLLDGLVHDVLHSAWSDAGIWELTSHLAERQAVDRADADSCALQARERGRSLGMAGLPIARVMLPARKRQDPVELCSDALLERPADEHYAQRKPLVADGKTTDFNRATLADAAVCLRVSCEASEGASRLQSRAVAVRPRDPLLAAATALEQAGAGGAGALELDAPSAVQLLANLKVLGRSPDSVHAGGGALARGWAPGAGGLIGLVELLARKPERGAVAGGDLSGQGYAFAIETP